ncbi:MAG: hypothetical protein PSV22_26265 [Pseudolabrys sp.]|nr:hypothetical protein [Pseudolabrys sp.]
MKALVFIDHDIVCRHFVQNGALAELVRSADVRFVFPAGRKRLKLSPEELPLGAPFTSVAVDPQRQQTWRWVLYADQLKLRLGRHESAIRRIRWMTLGWKAATLLTLAGLPIGASIFRKIVADRLNCYPNRELADLLTREKPDIVFHPSVLDGVFINDLVAEGNRQSIPIVVATNSWDNPSTKRAVVGHPDKLLVWGPQSREHAIQFIGAPRNKVVEFGAAQFDVFNEHPRIDRAGFCAVHGIDPSRKIVLFAGSNAQTDEGAALDALDDAIEAGRAGPITVVYRPHPWGGGGQGGALLAGRSWRYIVVDKGMRGYLDSLAKGDASMALPDYHDTHDLLCSVDAVVSPLSTILLEAVMHGKPVAIYLPEGDDAVLSKMIPLLHFEEFFALNDVSIARGSDELVGLLPVLVSAEGVACGARLKDVARRFVTPFQRPWRERIVDLLGEVVRERALAGRQEPE